MPAPLVADWSQVKATAVSLGSLKAASDAHPEVSYQAIQQRAWREKWPVKSRELFAEAQSELIAKAHANGGTSQAVKLAVRTQSEPVRDSGDAQANHLAATGEATRASLARALSRSARHAETLAGEDSLSQARNVHEVAKAAALVHGWAVQGQGPQVLIQVLGGSGED